MTWSHDPKITRTINEKVENKSLFSRVKLSGKIQSRTGDAHRVKFRAIVLAIIVSCFSCSPIQADPNGHPPTLILDDGADSFYPGQSQEILEDPGKNLGLEQVVRAPGFIPVQNQTASQGASSSAYWLRFQVENNSQITEWLLQAAFPLIEDLRIFVVSPSGSIVQREMGIKFRFSQRGESHRTFLTRMQLNHKERYTIYMRFESRTVINMPIRVWSPGGFQRASTVDDLVLGGFYGILLIMCAYNLLLFLTIRDSTYLYYVVYTISGALFIASQQGHGHQYLWPENPDLGIRITGSINGVFVLCSAAFSRKFLNLKKLAPALGHILLGFAIIAGVGTLISFVAPFSLRTVLFLAPPGAFVIFFSGLVLAIRGHRHAQLFTVAFSLFLAGGFLYALRNAGFLPYNTLTTDALPTGMVLELAMMSLALADRINELRAEKEKARISEQIKSQFLARVSHDLKTPLNAIIGYTQLMLEEAQGTGSKQFVSDLRSIDRAGKHQLELINNLLDLARIEAGKISLSAEEFDLVKLAGDVADTMRVLAEAKGNNLAFRSESKYIGMYSDATKLRQILLNLLSNSCKFTKDGKIELKVRIIQKSDEWCVLEVSDTGIGMNDAQIQKVFQPFEQATGAIARDFGGIGLGLAIVKEFTEMLGGSVRLSSQEGVGSVFTIELPLKLKTSA